MELQWNFLSILLLIIFGCITLWFLFLLSLVLYHCCILGWSTLRSKLRSKLRSNDVEQGQTSSNETTEEGLNDVVFTITELKAQNSDYRKYIQRK
jgi:hypothetical protein